MTKQLMSTVISATMIQHSITPEGTQLYTMELEYPRFIHSEFMTHRVFSRNAASSRAIKVSTLVGLVKSQLAHPIHWGENKAGMQSEKELDDSQSVQEDWVRASQYACYIAERMDSKNAHKHIVNRIIENFGHIKVVMSTTEIDNFMELRDHPAAAPEIQMLAQKMKEAIAASTPMAIKPQEAHVPYVDRKRLDDGTIEYSVLGQVVDLTMALKISASACAQVSYRLLNLGIDKALDMYERLASGSPVHASPFEHQAFPMPKGKWPKGATHMTRDGTYWSGNLRGWVQYRHILGEF